MSEREREEREREEREMERDLNSLEGSGAARVGHSFTSLDVRVTEHLLVPHFLI
jgi:hypothetical protein